ncbi:MAG TPA: hypothetical protein VE130_15160, partial [Nitrososphaeraceae archaeon]|nr:hypothetical protein [Nitrososphaeraceae archaeon]
MRTSTLVIISIITIVSVLTWLVSIWQYDTMMSSMMTFYNPSALSLFVLIWTAGMAAMMFPAIVPMILVYNRLIVTNRTKNNADVGNSQIIYHKSNGNPNEDINNKIRHEMEGGGEKRISLNSLRSKLGSRSYDIVLFVSTYLAIWALTGLVLLVGWSLLYDAIFSHLEDQRV